IALDLSAQRFVGTEDVLLADIVFQPLRAHALCQGALGIAIGRLRFGRRVVEQAHARAALRRRASYSRTAAATAAFRDSTPVVGIDMARAAADSSAPTPRASLPITMAVPAVRSVWSSGRPPVDAAE